jgi:hypothetical protein
MSKLKKHNRVKVIKDLNKIYPKLENISKLLDDINRKNYYKELKDISEILGIKENDYDKMFCKDSNKNC